MTSTTMHSITKMPSIGNFRNVVKELEKLCDISKIPTLEAYATVKLHGTNASLLYTIKEDKIYPQKKTSIISLENDNFGFAKFVLENYECCYNIIEQIKLILNEKMTKLENIVVFGEWAGLGIQKKVAISQLPKTFYIFGILIIDYENNFSWLCKKSVSSIKPLKPILNLYHFETFSLTINFSNISDAHENMKIQLEYVENEDPVAKSLGVSGIGEGLVYTIENFMGKRIVWKIKGEKHCQTNKKIKIDDSAINTIVEKVLPIWRLEQGVFEIFNNQLIEKKLYGNYLKWIVNDIIKEELDVIEKSGFKLDQIKKQINKEAINYLNSL